MTSPIHVTNQGWKAEMTAAEQKEFLILEPTWVSKHEGPCTFSILIKELWLNERSVSEIAAAFVEASLCQTLTESRWSSEQQVQAGERPGDTK